MMINQLAEQNIEDVFFERGFLVTLESFMTSLREGEINVLNVPDAINYKYVGDFYGLLNYFNVPTKYHHIVTRFNGYKNSNDYNSELTIIVLPDFNVIERLKNIYVTKNN